MLPLSVALPIENGINFRDLGGIITQDGRKIRSCLLYRSGDFSQITSSEQNFISNNLNIINVLDYRDPTEVKQRPNNLWQQAQYCNVPANPMSSEVTADLSQMASLKNFFPADFMIKLYQLLPFNNPAYKKLVTLLSQNGQSIVQHCAVGKDRTGVGVALTLFILGVDEETIMQDYLLSDLLLSDFRTQLFERYKNILTDEELESRKPFFAAKPEYLQSAIDAIKHRYQTIDRWLENEYQLTQERRRIIQNNYLIE